MWNWFKGNANDNYAFPATMYRFAFGQKSKKVDWSIDLAVPVHSRRAQRRGRTTSTGWTGPRRQLLRGQ